MQSAATSPSSTPSEQQRAGPDETAKTKDNLEMKVATTGRLHFTKIHLWKNHGAKTHLYDNSKDAPSNQVLELALLPDEHVTGETVVTKEYMWVGIMCGKEPGQYRAKSSGRKKAAETKVLELDQSAVPIAVAMEDYIPIGCNFMVVCKPVSGRRNAKPISFDRSTIFIFDEFLTSPTAVEFSTMNSHAREATIKSNIRYHVARNKTAKERRGAMEKGLLQTPSGTDDDESTGVAAFFIFEREITMDKAVQLVAELKTAHPAMGVVMPEVVVRIQHILADEEDLQDQISHDGLLFFLEECCANWSDLPDTHITTIKRVAATTNRHLRLSNTLMTSDERTDSDALDS